MNKFENADGQESVNTEMDQKSIEKEGGQMEAGGSLEKEADDALLDIYKPGFPVGMSLTESLRLAKGAGEDMNKMLLDSHIPLQMHYARRDGLLKERDLLAGVSEALSQSGARPEAIAKAQERIQTRLGEIDKEPEVMESLERTGKTEMESGEGKAKAEEYERFLKELAHEVSEELPKVEKLFEDYEGGIKIKLFDRTASQPAIELTPNLNQGEKGEKMPDQDAILRLQGLLFACRRFTIEPTNDMLGRTNSGDAQSVKNERARNQREGIIASTKFSAGIVLDNGFIGARDLFKTLKEVLAQAEKTG